MSCLPVLYEPVAQFLGELRTAWATGRRVALSLEGCDVARLEGTVRRVAASGAFAQVGALMVPLDRVLAVHLPSRLGDSTVRAGTFHGPGRRLVSRPGQLELS